MPFHFKSYEKEVREWPTKKLIVEKRKYSRSAGGASVGGGLAAGASILFPPALIFVATSAATAANAGAKLAIIDNELSERDEKERYRIRDFVGGGLLSVACHGLGHGVDHALNHTVSHLSHPTLALQLDHKERMAAHFAGEIVDHEADLIGDEVADSILRRVCDQCYKVSCNKFHDVFRAKEGLRSLDNIEYTMELGTAIFALILITATNATGCIEAIMRTVIISHGSERSWSNLDKIARFCLDELVLFRMRSRIFHFTLVVPMSFMYLVCTHHYSQLPSYIYDALLNIIIATSSLLQPID
jgi:hypothetical protein